MKIRERSLALLLLAAALGSAGCPGTAPDPGPEHRTVTDASGTALRLPLRPRRIVSLLPSITASIVHLGAGDRIVGRTKWCPAPPGDRSVVVGDMLRPDLERIVALEADVVLGSMEGSSQAHVKKMRSAGIPVYVFGECASYLEMKEQLRRLGALLGLSDRARKTVEEADARVEKVRTRLRDAEPKKVFLQLGESPLVSCGSGTFLHEMLGWAGGRNIIAAVKGRYPRVSPETVLVKDPQVIVIVRMAGEETRAPRTWRGFPDLAAVRTDRIHVVDADLLCQPTPFAFARALETLARLLHPGRFPGG
jgi:iron complex transport system substrate-binding protein